MSSNASQLSAAATGFSSSAEDMQNLGQALGKAMQLYNDSNQNLIDSLNRIEAALDTSTARSDEQMSYYVAQPREIIDQTLMSQQELVEEVRELVPQAIAKAS